LAAQTVDDPFVAPFDVPIRGADRLPEHVVAALQARVLAAFDFHPFHGSLPSQLAAYSPVPGSASSGAGGVDGAPPSVQQHVHGSGLAFVTLTRVGFLCYVNFVASLQSLRAEALAVRAEFVEWCNDAAYIDALLALMYLESLSITDAK
jgi:hypothetical protein